MRLGLAPAPLVPQDKHSVGISPGCYQGHQDRSHVLCRTTSPEYEVYSLLCG